MEKCFEQTGIATEEMVKAKFPPMERINKGAVAVAECYQRIPCNPCQTACAFNAINVGEDINNMPEVSFDACRGCGICVSKCPGLAIMIIDGSIEEATVDMHIPYEFLPLPEAGKTVKGVDRSGEYVCDVLVVDVKNPKSCDRTPVVRIRVPRERLYSVRNIRLED